MTIWTTFCDSLKPDPDAFFQRHLHMGAYPMAPYPEATTALLPIPGRTNTILDYGPLLDAMCGKKWVLSRTALRSKADAA